MTTAVGTTWHEDVLVLRVSGELDLHGTDGLRRTLREAASGPGHGGVIVDLTPVGFVDSAGLGVLVGAQKSLRTRGRGLALVIRSEDVMRMLRISSLARLFAIHDSVEAALEASGAVAGRP